MVAAAIVVGGGATVETVELVGVGALGASQLAELFVLKTKFFTANHTPESSDLDAVGIDAGQWLHNTGRACAGVSYFRFANKRLIAII